MSSALSDAVIRCSRRGVVHYPPTLDLRAITRRAEKLRVNCTGKPFRHHVSLIQFKHPSAGWIGTFAEDDLGGTEAAKQTEDKVVSG
jgi:hypothetical protein